MYCINQKVLIINGCYSGLVGIILKQAEFGFYMVKPLEDCLPAKYLTEKEIEPYKKETK